MKTPTTGSGGPGHNAIQENASQSPGHGRKKALERVARTPSMPRTSASSGGLFGRKSSFFGTRQKPDPGAQTAATTEPPSQSEASSASSRRRGTASTRHSISSSVTDIGASIRRSTSKRSSSTSSAKLTSPSTTTLATISYSPEKGAAIAHVSKPTLSVSTFARRQKSSDNVRDQREGSIFSRSPLSASEANGTVGMTAVPLRYPHQTGRPPTAQSNINFGQSNASLGPTASIAPSANSPNPHAVFQHIHDMASKRISTLDYLRKVSVRFSFPRLSCPLARYR